MAEKEKKGYWKLLLLIPLIISISFLFYLKYSWQIEVAPGIKLSPIENKPLFVGIIIFTIGYLFFLGMLFSDDIINFFNSRWRINKR
ncbi:hypothetical protein GF323_03895 [Candidatus Woesearchaeota archaeon]|nr:hypothetical protein [Candidatus Woesearchaeota archaeon]